MVEVDLEMLAIWVGTIVGFLWYIHEVKMEQKKKHKRIYERLEWGEDRFEEFRMKFFEFKKGNN